MKRGQKTDDRLLVLRRIALCALSGALILFILLFIAAMMSDKYQNAFIYRVYLSKLCLAVSSYFCGCISAGRAARKRVLHALAGESGVFLAAGILGLVFGFPGGPLAYLSDIGIMLFGAFAGALSVPRRRKQRRGKR